MSEALNLPLLYDLAGRAGALMSLIQQEVRQLPVLPLSLPRRQGLDERCLAFRRQPQAQTRSMTGPGRSV